MKVPADRRLTDERIDELIIKHDAPITHDKRRLCRAIEALAVQQEPNIHPTWRRILKNKPGDWTEP